MPPAPKGPAWTRLEDKPPARPRITRDQIVDVAIALADAEGLDAVSIRRVAAVLETRPMGLYSHIDRKDDLIDLMIDRIAGDFLLETVADDWREALRADRPQHPRRVPASPVDRRRDGPAAGVRAERDPPPRAVARRRRRARAGAALALQIVRVVDKFTLGQVIYELGQREMLRRDGADRRRLAALGDRLHRRADRQRRVPAAGPRRRPARCSRTAIPSARSRPGSTGC